MLFLLRKLLALFVYFDIYNSTALVQYHCTFSFLYDVVLININKNSPYLQKRGNTCYVNDDLCTHLDQNTNMFCQNCNLHIYYLFKKDIIYIPTIKGQVIYNWISKKSELENKWIKKKYFFLTLG